VIALDPILQLSGLIAGILSDFEHRYYDDLDGNAPRRGQQGRAGQASEEQEEGDPFEEHDSMICTGARAASE
jgi:hypothetical protein